MLLFVYTTALRKFVIFTSRYFKLSWNTTVLSQSNCRNFSWSSVTYEIGPLQLTIHVVQNRHAGEQKSHWDKTNKGNYHLELCMPLFVLSHCDFLLSSIAVCTTWMASCKRPIQPRSLDLISLFFAHWSGRRERSIANYSRAMCLLDPL